MPFPNLKPKKGKGIKAPKMGKTALTPKVGLAPPKTRLMPSLGMKGMRGIGGVQPPQY